MWKDSKEFDKDSSLVTSVSLFTWKKYRAKKEILT